MGIPQFLENLSAKFHENAGVRSVYGDAFEVGGRKVIPVAKVMYGLGAGYGKLRTRDAGGNEQVRPVTRSGGGGIRVVPLGVLEVGPDRTRFVPLRGGRPRLAAALLLAFAAGLLAGRFVW